MIPIKKSEKIIRKKRYIFIGKVRDTSGYYKYRDLCKVSLLEGFQVLDMVGAAKRGRNDQVSKQHALVFVIGEHIALECIHHYTHYY